MSIIAQSRNARKRQRSRPSCKEQHLQCVTEKRESHQSQDLNDGNHICEMFNPPLNLKYTLPIAVYILDSICVVPDAVHAMILTHHGCFGRYTQLRTTEKLIFPSVLPQRRPNSDVPSFVLAHEEVLYLMEKLHVIQLFRVEDLGSLFASDVFSSIVTPEEFRNLASTYNPRFQDIYKTYFALRGLGYTPKSALRYGSDLLLYDGSPMSTHSKYCIYVRSTDADTRGPCGVSEARPATPISTTTSHIFPTRTISPMSSFSAASLFLPPSSHSRVSHLHSAPAEGLPYGLMMGLDTCLHTRIARFAHKQTLYVTVEPPQPSTDSATLRTISHTHAYSHPRTCANLGGSDVMPEENARCGEGSGGTGSVDKARAVTADDAGVDGAEDIEETRVAGGQPRATDAEASVLGGQLHAMEGCVQDDDAWWAVQVAGDAEVEIWERALADRACLRTGGHDEGFKVERGADGESGTIARGGVAKAVGKVDEERKRELGGGDSVTRRRIWAQEERRVEGFVEGCCIEREAVTDNGTASRSQGSAISHREEERGKYSVGGERNVCAGHVYAPVMGENSRATGTLHTDTRVLGLDVTTGTMGDRRGCILYMQTITPWRTSYEATRKNHGKDATRTHIAK